MPPLIAVRHGQTGIGAQGRFQGHLPVGLDETGRMQADEAGKRLANIIASRDLLGPKYQIVSSSLPRAMETALVIASHLDVPASAIASEPALREMGFGSWEGMTTHEVKAHYPELRRARKIDRWNFAAPGGESFADLAERVGKWLESLKSPAIVIAHSGTIRVIGHLLAGWKRERALAEKIGYCEARYWKNNEFLRL